MMFCNNCGNQLSEGALFCQKCGAKVNGVNGAYRAEEAVSDTVMNQKNNTDAMPTDSEAVPEVSAADQTEAEPYNARKDRLNREKQFEHYKEMSQEMLGNLKKVPYHGILDKLKKMPLAWKAGAWVAAGIILIIILCAMIHKPGGDVRDAYLEAYSNLITVEEAFDSFFDNGKWSEYKEDGDKYVIFTGKCFYLDKKVDVKIRFRIKGDYFYFVNMEMNGQPQSDIISEALLDKVYEGYY